MAINIFEEILESEKGYLEDLQIWSEKFRYMLLNYSRLNSINKRNLVEKIFYNYQDICSLHKSIVSCFKDCKNAQEIDFVELFLNYIERFDCYVDYAFVTPIAEVNARLEVIFNKSFKDCVIEFLKQGEFFNLTTSHFILRPVQRIMRYELYLEKLRKNIKNQEKKDKIDILLEKFKEISQKVSINYSNTMNFARIYEIYSLLESKGDNTTALDLINLNRQLIKEGECVLNYESNIIDDKMGKLFLFDNLILICLRNIDGTNPYMKIFEIIQLGVARFEYDHKNVWIKIYSSKYCIILKFHLHKIRNSWYEKFIETQQALAIESMTNIEEIRVNFYGRYKFKSISSVNYTQRGFQYTESAYNRFKSEINMAGLYFQPEDIFSFWNVLGEKTGICEKNIVLPIFDDVRPHENTIFFATPYGIYRKIHDDEIMIYNMSASKIHFDRENYLVIFLSNNRIYVSSYYEYSNFLNPKFIQNNVTNFFVYYLRDLKFLAIVSNSGDYYSEVLIYNISTQNKKIYLSFIRKAFLGIHIKQIFGIDDMTIVVSESTKIVNMYTLEIWPFLNPFNYILSYHLHCVDDKNPSFVWQLDNDTIMICFSSFAIYVDRNGNTKSDINILLWQFEAKNFNIAKDFLIVSGHKEYALIKEKRVLRYKRKDFFKIAIVNDEIYVFETDSVYKVIINLRQ